MLPAVEPGGGFKSATTGMNILYHHRTLGDGAEGIHVASMVKAFRELDHDVKLASLIGEQVASSTSRARIVDQLRNVLPRALYETMEMAYSAAGYRLLTRQVNGWKPAFIYERYTLFNLAGLMAARRLGIPLVLEVNSPLAYERAQYETLRLKRAARFFERFLFRRAELVLAVSTPLKEYIIGQGASPEKVVVMPNGTDPSFFRPDTFTRDQLRRRLDLPLNAVVVGFVGILRPWHGVDLLIDAFAKVQNPAERMYLLIVGDGPSQSALEKLSRLRGLQERVIFTGRVPHQEVARYLTAMDIAVSPRATFYASPMKVLEYMATGIAVIAPRMPNLQDLISDQVDGILFQPENVEELTSSVQALVQNGTFRRRLADNARRKIENDRTWVNNAKRTLELIGNSQKWN
jgi:glycosyltransferase involved in cell wall biosynthesis